ncbi:hypothetical protein PF005_g21582 [Phytophthora fragariae]|uniref:Uncharacterized protein n=4 Tax=Phytophthora TaxID=4783 RepID=A0A6A4CK64_9STRA|nr:hypothetical protein PF003_g28418 [Phytophthora fragariae]KAE8961824.1 hypothetical protein PR001_g29918 [Phytophthora rubi]KAE8887594.1 hypothetical protein PF003_g28413 [Phytophthora fragariae]KAE8927286.1 hypothetical protein PF009_g22545 [Phytophthora fragariae]KAE9073466.1 hypothetical protein PF010_g25059 [Phytophthora fragariae]
MVLQVMVFFLVLTVCGPVVSNAASGHFFVDANFGVASGHWVYNFSKSQFCINMGIFDDKVSSAQWSGLPQTGSFASNQSLVAFYTDRNCTGTVRTWPTAEKNFPTNFALDGIDNQISSFMVWQTSSHVQEIAPDPTFLD